jgi:hypothetical protein
MRIPRAAFVVLVLSVLACSVAPTNPTPTTVPTSAPSATHAPAATAAPQATATRRPTASPTVNPAQAEVEDLQASGMVGVGGHFVPVQTTFTISEARNGYWIWYPIEDGGSHQDFAIGADISWEAASESSNWWNTGCGFFVRPRDDDGLGGYFVAQTADGLPWLLWWKPGAQYLVDLLRPASYDYYAGASAGKRTGSQHIVAIAQGPTLRFLVDGEQKIYRDDTAEQAGFIGAVVVSGTNKDYGTRCEFSNLWLYSLNGGDGTSG